MENNINFRGGFLINHPSKYTWGQMEKIFPKRKCIFQKFNDEGDKFIAIKDNYDSLIADYLLKSNVKFSYYPDINLKSRLDPRNVEEAQNIINKETNIISSKKNLLEYIQRERKQYVLPNNYQWSPGDHIPKTMKLLELNPADHEVKIKDGIAIIKDKEGNIIAKSSPNSHTGMNYVYVLADCGKIKAMSRLAVNHEGKIEWKYSANEITTFYQNFMRAVNIGNGRKMPKSHKE